MAKDHWKMVNYVLRSLPDQWLLYQVVGAYKFYISENSIHDFGIHHVVSV